MRFVRVRNPQPPFREGVYEIIDNTETHAVVRWAGDRLGRMEIPHIHLYQDEACQKADERYYKTVVNC